MFILKFVYFERESARPSASGGGAEGEEEKESQAAPVLAVQSAVWGSVSRTMRSSPEPKPTRFLYRIVKC